MSHYEVFFPDFYRGTVICGFGELSKDGDKTRENPADASSWDAPHRIKVKACPGQRTPLRANINGIN
jgi:hypothetical protein